MVFNLARNLGKKLNMIKQGMSGKNLVSSSSNSGPIGVYVKSINEISDKSNNNDADLGRDINQLLSETLLPEDIKSYLQQRYQNVVHYYETTKCYTKEQTLAESIKLKGDVDLEIDLVIALMNRANKIGTGYELRPAQIFSILEFFRDQGENKFCQINTGEGKTTVTSAIAVIKALQGETVDIVTSNEILAEDAIRARSDFYALFNLSVAHNNADQRYVTGLKDCYLHDIVYGTIGNFEFDYLRHLMQFSNTKGNRAFGLLIIDEADNVVLDNATHVAKTSRLIPGMEALKYVYITIWQELIKSEQNLGLRDEELESMTIVDKQLIRANINKHNIKNNSIVPKFLESYLDRKLDTWIDNALRARYDYHQNQHYIIDKKDIDKKNPNSEENIIPLDVQVGVTQQNTIWTDLHPFVQIKHNLQVTQDSLTSVFIANSEYIRNYQNILGLTGTLGSQQEREVIKTLYGAASTIIPTYKPSKMDYKNNLLVEDEEWLRSLADDAIDHAVSKSRASLVICKTIQDVLNLQQLIEEVSNVDIITYKNERDAYTIQEINENGGIRPRTIVIATNIGGRGTDIKLSSEVIENGGLHEITTFIASSRILKQASGRAARQGEPGSSRIIIKHKDTEEFGIDLENNFTNQDIYDLVDEIDSARISRFIPEINRVESDGKYFARFASLYAEANFHEVSEYILEDLKLQWALAFDEKNNLNQRNNVKISEVFAKFEKAIAKTQDSDHQFINPYFAVKYAESILALESNSSDKEDLSYDKAISILKQSSVLEDPELQYAVNMKFFEITISKAQKNELKRLAGKTNTEDQAEPRQYKVQAKKYLEDAQKALTKKIKSIEDMIISGDFHNIILPRDALNNNGANFMLKHIESKYASMQLRLQHVNSLIEHINNSGNKDLYISSQNSLNQLIKKIVSQDISKKIYQEELGQIESLGEDSFYNLGSLPGIDLNPTNATSNPRIEAAMRQISAGFAENALSSDSFAKSSPNRDSLMSGGIFDIIRVIFSEEENSATYEKDSTISIMAFDFAKTIEILKILRRVGSYVAEDIKENMNKVVSNCKQSFAQLSTKVNEQVEMFSAKIANINPNGLLKVPKKPAEDASETTSDFADYDSDVSLEGSNNDITKKDDIDGINSYFGKYTLDGVKHILKLRLHDAGIDNLKVSNNSYSFIDRDKNNIQDLFDELESFSSPVTILVPLNLYNKHAAGILCLIEHEENNSINYNNAEINTKNNNNSSNKSKSKCTSTFKNNIKIFYIDPENQSIPTDLDQIFKQHELGVESLIVETQEYANCGPEVIENFMLYLTGERLSQTESIPYHSLLVEHDLPIIGCIKESMVELAFDDIAY